MSAPTTPPGTTTRRPDDDEIDVYGLSHVGKVRKQNQDHFLLASIQKRLHVLHTNLTDQDRLALADRRLAFIAIVADGVGGGVGGEEASATTLEVATEYLLSTVDCHDQHASFGDTFIEALQDTAMRSHQAVIERAGGPEAGSKMATTLTLWLGVWPWYYLLQVGDSRYYVYRDGALTQVTRDQTIAQDLVDQGVFTRAVADRSQFANVLSSSIGGHATMPVITRLRADWHNVHLLCTDGLTKHVSDERIAECLAGMTSARQVCEQLLQEALDGGGSDNISIIVGRATPKDDATT
ncbi:MAG: protein phosphatase 2C domain-containing protein [Gemmatimonadota bacterium]